MRASVGSPQFNRHRHCEKAYCPYAGLCRQIWRLIFGEEEVHLSFGI
ncbi:MAG TPA: hypothetical protein IGR15_01430 [Synechococcus sp. M44_DOE_062]|nr:hypothetical protein [Synechococcus sp. M44_DOE_062]